MRKYIYIDNVWLRPIATDTSNSLFNNKKKP